MRALSAGVIVVIFITGIFLINPKLLTNLNNQTWDLLAGWTGPSKSSGNIVLAEIDEKSLKRNGAWPWPRNLMGLLGRRIIDQGAAVVVFDIMFPKQEESHADKRLIDGSAAPIDGTKNKTGEEFLAEALSAKPTIVGYTFRFDKENSKTELCDINSLPLVIVRSDGSREAAFFHASGALCSASLISKAATGNGFLNGAPDSDGKIRRIPLIIEYHGQYYQSLALAALSLQRQWSSLQLGTDAYGTLRLKFDSETVPLEETSLMRLNFRGGGRTFPYISATDILTGHVPAGVLKGKIVIVGSSALGLENPVTTPTDTFFPGIEIQATAIDNLIKGDPLSRPANARLLELAIALIAGLLSACLLVFVRFVWGIIATCLLAIAGWAGCILAFKTIGVLFSPLPVTAVLACNLLTITLFNYFMEKERADQSNRQLDSTKEFTREVLEKSESRYQRLAENVNDAIVMDDVEGRLVFANRRFREWFGLGEKDIHNVVIEDYVALESLPLVRNYHDCRIKGEFAPDHYEFKGIRSNGMYIWIEAQVATVKEGGRIVGTQSALRDITARKQIEAQFLQAQKMESVGRLAGSVAHDFNNLLTVINGYSELLLHEMGQDNPFRSSIEQILLAGEHSAELAKKLLAISRKQLVQPIELNLNQVLSAEEKILRRLIGEDIELVIQLSPEATTVMADSGHLHQVLMNLVVNARDSMPSGGKIIIETRNVIFDEASTSRHPDLAPGSYVYLGVTDSGTGMSKEVKSHLFEPFFTTKEVSRGTGLGLTTVHSIVHQSGGWIGVTSEMNQGTTIHIYLPRITIDLTPQPLLRNASISVQRGQETVLVVEDQDAVRRLISTVLEGYGYRVLQVSNGPDALELAEKHWEIIHLLLTDLILPFMNGRVLAETLIKNRPQIKVLYISGYAEETIGNSGILDNNLVFLAKPFSPEALATKVREVLEG
jgi:PAS domain S-box-containing protein